MVNCFLKVLIVLVIVVGVCIFSIGMAGLLCDKPQPSAQAAPKADPPVDKIPAGGMHEYVKRHMELAYLYGQSDALSGIVRVAKNDSVWYYTRSPWDEPTDSAHVAIPDFTVPVKRAEEDPFSIKY